MKEIKKPVEKIYEMGGPLSEHAEKTGLQI
jgi:hypothetical protein